MEQIVNKYETSEDSAISDKYFSYSQFLIFLKSQIQANKDNNSVFEINNAVLAHDSYRNHLIDIISKNIITKIKLYLPKDQIECSSKSIEELRKNIETFIATDITKISDSNHKPEHKQTIIDFLNVALQTIDKQIKDCNSQETPMKYSNFEKNIFEKICESAKESKKINVTKLLNFINNYLKFNSKSPEQMSVFYQVKEYLEKI